MESVSRHDVWDGYNLSDLEHDRGDTLLDLAFRLRGDTLQLAIEAKWFTPHWRPGDSIPTRRWARTNVPIAPDEVLAAFCNGPGIRDSMRVFAVASPTATDTFQAPRLAWRADPVHRKLVPLPVSGLHCPSFRPFTDAVMPPETARDELRWAIQSWWNDVQMMMDRIASKRLGSGTGG